MDHVPSTNVMCGTCSLHKLLNYEAVDRNYIIIMLTRSLRKQSTNDLQSAQTVVVHP